jgi:butyrate kinase
MIKGLLSFVTGAAQSVSTTLKPHSAAGKNLVDTLVASSVSSALSKMKTSGAGAVVEVNPVKDEPSGGSAIPAGRMRKTDVIKGSSSPIPNEAGIYRHVDKKTGEVQYVGRTRDLRTRQQAHARDGRLDVDQQLVQYSVAKPTATQEDLSKTEIDHIARHKPAGNKTRGGNGRN